MDITSMPLLADTWDTNGHMGGGWWIVMMLGMVLFWAAFIIGIAWLIRGSSHGWREGRRDTPLEILERRFAQGDISADEYHERRDVIIRGPSRSRTEPSEPARH
jgi:putative membrane protein